MTEKYKVMVLGFDGSSYNVLLPLIKRGMLPNFAKIINDGVWGDLRSTIPPLSGPAWATFATGKNPGKHGIYDFFRNVPENYSCTPINSSFLSAKPFWEILSEQGNKVAVMNMLFTYPPSNVNGFIITGRETPSEDASYTYPKSLKEEILSLDPDYKVELHREISPTKHFLRSVISRLKCQERINSSLLKKYQCDFSMSFFAIPDIINHIFWPCMDHSHPNYRKKNADAFLPLIEECFVELDNIVGNRLQMMDDNTVLFIMSDHGAGPAYKTFQINRWLQEEGFFAVKEEYGKSKGAFVIFLKDALKAILNQSSRFDIFGLRRIIGFRTREKRRELARKKIVDWSKTKAYSGRIGEYGIHLNVKGREGMGIVEPGAEYENIRNAIIKKLSGIKDPSTDGSILKNVFKREDIYQGAYVKYAPDLILDFGDNPYQPGDNLLAKKVLEDIPFIGIAGMHRDLGVLMGLGKGVKSGGKFDGARIMDLAPTILHLLGARIPDDMDGEVLTGILSPSFSGNKARYYHAEGVHAEKSDKLFYNEDEKDEISKRLSDLGYL